VKTETMKAFTAQLVYLKFKQRIWIGEGARRGVVISFRGACLVCASAGL
jgi:hypothetical protein